jgi:hypothetical protein
MRVVMIFPKRLAVPDGDPCDRCPRTLGRGGRYVRVFEDGSARTMHLCSGCVTAIRKTADHVALEA